MMKVISLTAFLFLLPLVFGDRAAKIQQIVNDVDANGDGLISENELHAEFVVRMDVNSDWVITKDEFMNTGTGWPYFYGDSTETTEAFFNNLDIACIRLIRGSILSGCGRLGPLDVIQHYQDMDQDGDQVVTVAQLSDWLDKVYP